MKPICRLASGGRIREAVPGGAAQPPFQVAQEQVARRRDGRVALRFIENPPKKRFGSATGLLAPLVQQRADHLIFDRLDAANTAGMIQKACHCPSAWSTLPLTTPLKTQPDTCAPTSMPIP